MAEEKKFPTPEMLKAREAWAKKPEEEKKAFWDTFDEEIRRRRERSFSPEVQWLLKSGEYDDK